MNFYNGKGEKISIETSGNSSAIGKPWADVLHQGWNEGVPGNTLPAYYLVKENGYEWGECDIRLTSDLIPVVYHNASVTGTVDGVETTLTIAESTAAEVTAVVLQTHDTYGDIHVPTLAELLDLARCLGIGMVLDIKSAGNMLNADNNKILAKTVLASGWAEHCVYMPLSTDMAAAIQSVDKNASFDFVSYAADTDSLPNLTAYTALLTGANTVGFDFNASVTDSEGGLPNEMFDKLRENGLSVSFWNIRSGNYSTYFDVAPLRVTYAGYGSARLGQTYLNQKTFW